MAKTDYLDQTDSGFSAQLKTCKDSLPAYSAVLGLSAAKVASQADDADYFAFLIASQTVVQNSARQYAVWKNLVRSGGTLPPTGAPVPPSMPEAVTAVAPGIEARFRALVREIKSSSGYNAAIGIALGIEGSNKAAPDLGTIAPKLTATLIGGQIDINWGWQGHSASLDMIEIHVNRGGGYSLLTYDTTPGYTDTSPLPAAPVKWTYKAIYRVGDQQTGQWSAEVSITVGG
ncbi:MAG: hypothetical protein ABI073_12680 [Luteolibacter sp.]